MPKASHGLPQCIGGDHVRSDQTSDMRAWLFGMLLALCLPDLVRGWPPGSDLILEPNKPTSVEATLDPSISALHGMSSTFGMPIRVEIPMGENTFSGVTTLNSTGILSNPGLSETKFFDKSTQGNNSNVAGNRVLSSNGTPSTLDGVSSKSLVSSDAIYKCCPRGEYFYQNTCKQMPANSNIRDPWGWIEPSQRQNLSLDPFNENKVSYGWKSCRRDVQIVLHFGSNDTMTLRRHQDGIRLGVAVEVEENNGDAMHEFAHGNFCLEKDWKDRYLALLCPCEELLCMRKCCKFGHKFDPQTSKCVEVIVDDQHPDWLPTFDKDWKMNQKYYTLEEFQDCAEHEKKFIFDDLDLVFLINGSIKSNVTGAVYNSKSYCGDISTSGKEILLVCLVAPSSKEIAISIALGVLLVIGSLALLLTVCISCALPDTRKRLHGRMTLMHNVMLLVGYVSMGALRLFTAGYSMSITASKVMSFVIQFSFLSAFFWLNVMCLDIAMVFSGWRPVQGTAMQQDGKKFLYYSAYAWGCVCLISAATAIAEFVPGARPRPGFGEEEYFFSNGAAMLLFFYGPMAILLAANVALFIYTAVKIKRAAQESRVILDSVDSRTTRKNKFRLAVYAKLLTLMGVTWVFEVLCWAIGGDSSVWFLSDAANILRAVLIFIIFCCNKHVYQLLKLRVQNTVGNGSSRVGADTFGPSTTSRTTMLESRSGKKSSGNGQVSASGPCRREAKTEKSDTCDLKDFARPLCQTVIGSPAQQHLKDIQL